MIEITGVVFKPGGKVYYFAPGKDEYIKGKGVIVKTARGVEYATVVIPRKEVEDDKVVLPLKPVIRVATERDEQINKKNTDRKAGAMKTVKEKIEKFNLDMKLIDCEFAFDGSKAVFYYTAPQRVDFRELVKELSSTFCMRVELRQVGLRDGIQMLGGLAPCGRECCCSSCMSDIKKVSIKMAKNQGLSLNPSKISGLCGRLMCCLSYENDYYAEACKEMPKLGGAISTPDGDGTVVNLNMLKMQVRVKIEDKSKDLITFKDYSVADLKTGADKKITVAAKPEPASAEEGEAPLPAIKRKPVPPLKKPQPGNEAENRRQKFKNRREKNAEKTTPAPENKQSAAPAAENKEGEAKQHGFKPRGKFRKKFKKPAEKPTE